MISAGEAAGLADLVNHANGSELKVEDFLSTYDADLLSLLGERAGSVQNVA